MKILMRADTHITLEIPETAPRAKYTLSQVALYLKSLRNFTKSAVYFQVIAALSVSLVSMMVGYSSAYTSPALVSMNSNESSLHITKHEVSESYVT